MPDEPMPDDEPKFDGEPEEDPEPWGMAGRSSQKAAINTVGVDRGDFVEFDMSQFASGHMAGNWRSREATRASVHWMGGLPFVIGHTDGTNTYQMIVRNDTLIRGVTADPVVEELEELGITRINSKLRIFKNHPVTKQPQDHLIEAIRSGELADVSTAFFYEPDGGPGTIDGKPYQHKEVRIRGAHVAGVTTGNPACKPPICGIHNDEDGVPCPELLCADENKNPKGDLSMQKKNDDTDDGAPPAAPPAAPAPPAPTVDVRDLGTEALRRNTEFAANEKKAAELDALKAETVEKDKRLADYEKAAKVQADAERVARIAAHEEKGKATLGEEKYAELFPKETRDALTCGDLERDAKTFAAALEARGEGGGSEGDAAAPPAKGKADRSLAPPGGKPAAGSRDLSDNYVEIGAGRTPFDIAYTPEELRRKQAENMGVKLPEDPGKKG